MRWKWGVLSSNGGALIGGFRVPSDPAEAKRFSTKAESRRAMRLAKSRGELSGRALVFDMCEYGCYARM